MSERRDALVEMKALARRFKNLADEVSHGVNCGVCAAAIAADLDAADEVLRALTLVNDRPRLGEPGGRRI